MNIDMNIVNFASLANILYCKYIDSSTMLSEINNNNVENMKRQANFIFNTSYLVRFKQTSQ